MKYFSTLCRKFRVHTKAGAQRCAMCNMGKRAAVRACSHFTKLIRQFLLRARHSWQKTEMERGRNRGVEGLFTRNRSVAGVGGRVSGQSPGHHIINRRHRSSAFDAAVTHIWPYVLFDRLRCSLRCWVIWFDGRSRKNMEIGKYENGQPS